MVELDGTMKSNISYITRMALIKEEQEIGLVSLQAK